MEWQEYISRILADSASFDGIRLSFGEAEEFAVPPIIKASVLMLDKMLEHQGQFNILVFPERIQSIFIFTLVKLLYNISEGRIDHGYDPASFKKGDRLRFESAVVEFDSVETTESGTRMKIRLADGLTVSAPLEFFPLFQHTLTRKKLSTNKQFVEAKKAAAKKLEQLSSNQRYVKLLADHKTHMDSSIVNMTSIINTKQLIGGCKLCGQSIKDAVLIGQADFEGNVRNIGAGQLGGVPAIVLASDLYAISGMVEKGHPIQSIIIDGSNANALVSQLPELDKLLSCGVPITCVTDVVNSFDLQPFLDRGFNLWRWDETSLTDKLYDATPLSSDRKTRHCANRKVDYLTSDGKEISTAIRLLYAHRKESQTASANMLKLFGRLFSYAFTALHETVPFSETQCRQVKESLEECVRILGTEKPFLAESTFADYKSIIDCLKEVFSFGYILPKHYSLAEKLLNTNVRSAALVVPERSNKEYIQQFWQSWCKDKGLRTVIDVLYPAEYYLASCERYDSTIVVGWLKRAVMRKTLYSFNTQTYTVLLYDYERRWKNYDSSRWNSALNSAENRKTIERSFSNDKIQVSTRRFVPPIQEAVEIPKADELSEIETVLRENKYRQYVASGGKKAENETVEAIPVNYVGGYLAFYRTGHKIISASDIIENDGDKIETKYPSELHLGDFIVVREVDRDLVKEMADIILEQSGMTEKRAIAGKWREALQIETLFNTPEQIYERLQSVGCTRGFQAVRSWIFDEDMIAPQSKQDLENIAAITGNDVLKEMLDQIYSAAQTVKTAHVQAGRNLSLLLRKRVVEALKDYGDIDPFNIWEPIEMMVDGIGTVRILKIIDIGAPVIVDITDTNRLIDEE